MKYQRDLIAERDQKTKLHSTIVKWWNDESLIARMKKQAEEAQAAQEAQLAAMSQTQNSGEDSEYNATTGSYSGGYGKNADKLNDSEKDQISNILGARNDDIMDLIKQNQE